MRSVTLTSYETSPVVAARQQLRLRSRAGNGRGASGMQEVPYRRFPTDRSTKNGVRNGLGDPAAARCHLRLPGRRPLYRLLMLLPIVFLVTLVMAIVQIMGDSDYFERLQGKESQPLYDLGHVLLPDLNDESKLMAEIPLTAMMALTILISLLVESRDRTRLIRRFTVLQCIMYLFRTLSLLGTRLPPSDPTCSLRRYEGMSVVVAALRIVLLLDSACTDMVFSGHTAAATSMVAVWIFHRRVHWTVRTAGAVNLALCGFGFVASRLHYTVDVVVAFIIAALLAGCYSSVHQLVKLKYPIVTESTPVYAMIIHWIEGYDLLETANDMIKTKGKYSFDLNTPHES